MFLRSAKFGDDECCPPGQRPLTHTTHTLTHRHHAHQQVSDSDEFSRPEAHPMGPCHVPVQTRRQIRQIRQIRMNGSQQVRRKIGFTLNGSAAFWHLRHRSRKRRLRLNKVVRAQRVHDAPATLTPSLPAQVTWPRGWKTNTKCLRYHQVPGPFSRARNNWAVFSEGFFTKYRI